MMAWLKITPDRIVIRQYAVRRIDGSSPIPRPSVFWGSPAKEKSDIHPPRLLDPIKKSANVAASPKMSKTGDITGIIGCVTGCAGFFLSLYNLRRDRYELSLDPRLELRTGHYFAKSVEFIVTVRNSGRRYVGIERLEVNGKESWFPNSPYNPFVNGNFSIFRVDTSNKAVVLGEGEAREFSQSFAIDSWKKKARHMKAVIFTTDGKTKNARFKLQD
jgi:hypothetical protein